MTTSASRLIYYCSIVGIASFMASSTLFAQTAAVSPDPDNLSKMFSSFLDPVSTAIGSILAGALVFAYQEFISKRKLARQIEDSFVSPKPVGLNEKRNSVLLVGLGGTGKTTLINRILLSKSADPKVKTEECTVYGGSRSVFQSNPHDNTMEREKTYHFFITDYKGQDIGTLVKGFIKLQSTRGSPIKLNYINSLIIMVDLFPPGDFHRDPDAEVIRDEPDAQRIQENLDQWSDVALDAIFGFLSANSLHLVCLFINKRDLLNSAYDDKMIKKAYESLSRWLRAKGGSTRFEIFIGSAERADITVRLEEALRETSVDHRWEIESK